MTSPLAVLQGQHASVAGDVEQVVMFGSRVIGTASEGGDWGLGVQLQPGWGDPLWLYGPDPELAQALGWSSGPVDVVDRSMASRQWG